MVSLSKLNMTWQEKLLDSFIKGIGKATAGMIVAGVIGGVWYTIVTRLEQQNNKKKTKKDSSTSTSSTTDEQEQDQLEMDDISSMTKVAHDEKVFRKIFDRF